MERKTPYTHWVYFTDRSAADDCKRAFERVGAEVRIERSDGDTDWLLRAGRYIGSLVEAHAEAEEMVNRHRGTYDYGETSIDLGTGEFKMAW